MEVLDRIERDMRETTELVENFVKSSEGRIANISDKVADLEQKGAVRFDFQDAPKSVSLMKVLKHLTNPRDNPLDGEEYEWHSELAQKNGGIPGMSNAVWIPLQTKADVDYATSSPESGGRHIIPTSTLQLIDILRAESVVLQQGVTRIPAEGNLTIPRKATTSTGYWFSGDGGDSITASGATFEALNLSPKYVGGLTTVSYRMMHQSGGGIERIIAEDLMGTLAEAFDNKALQGDGTSNTPTGVLNASGIGSLSWGGAASPIAYPTTRFWLNDAVDMEENLINSKAYKGNLSFLMDAATYRSIRWQETFTEGASMFGLDRDGKLLGHMVTPTTHMPANTALLGNWSEFIYADYGAIAIAVDQGGTNFAKGDTSIRAILPCDFGVRHGASFVKNAKP